MSTLKLPVKVLEPAKEAVKEEYCASAKLPELYEVFVSLVSMSNML